MNKKRYAVCSCVVSLIKGKRVRCGKQRWQFVIIIIGSSAPSAIREPRSRWFLLNSINVHGTVAENMAAMQGLLGRPGNLRDFPCKVVCIGWIECFQLEILVH